MNHLSDELLNEYLDFALAPDSRARVDAHLAVCPECSARLADWQILFTQIDSLPDLALDVDLSPVIMLNLKYPTRLPRPLWWLAGLQSAVVILTALLVWPLTQATLPASLFWQLPSFFGVFQFFTRIFNSWKGFALNLQLPRFSPVIPGLDLPTTPLVFAAVGLCLLWLAGNGLFFLPFSRRHS